MTPPSGLSTAEAARRATEQGPNRLPPAARTSPLLQLTRQFTHLMALLLWAGAGLALLAGLPPLAVAIVVVVILNAVFAFVQEYRADRSAERLGAMLPTAVRVRRDGRPAMIEAEDLVTGDVVLLGTGDRVAADLRVDRAHSLSVDESLVTGESTPVAHSDGDHLMAGTFVVQGEAEAVVTAIGSATTIAGIASLTRTARRPPSPLTQHLNRVVRAIALIAVTTGVLLGAAGVGMGLDATEAFLFGVGVTVALVPEGLLPTVTLSLARGAQLMAHRNALVRRLDAVETLGATTFICTDKTGTLTQNRMAVVEVWTPSGSLALHPSGYQPVASATGPPAALQTMAYAAAAAAQCVRGRVVQQDGGWVAEGDPMEAALHCWALGAGWHEADEHVELRLPFTADRMLSTVVIRGVSQVFGAPEAVIERSTGTSGWDRPAALEALHGMAHRGRRVVAVARRQWSPPLPPEAAERDLELLALVGLEDPPRPDVAASLEACRSAAIRVAMVTGDHPGTAAAIAREVGLLRPDGVVLDGSELPADDAELAARLDQPGGAVVARVTPADKLRIARVLRERGHVVAMTGDGVNDAPALREADVGVAMGATGSDVTREVADLVLLDDHFATIVAAVELGRATFANIRRFLTYHLADNVAELAPFAAWALSGGQLPLAIGVLQVLALDIGTDMLPALGLGAEPPSRRVMRGPARVGALVNRALLTRAFGVLGLTEAVLSMTAFVAVLTAGGWSWGESPGTGLLATASGTTFAVIATSQMANALACRSATHPVWQLRFLGNPLVLAAVAAEALLLVSFLGIPAVADLLGGTWPNGLGWTFAFAAAPLLLVVDALYKAVRRRGDSHRDPDPGAGLTP